MLNNLLSLALFWVVVNAVQLKVRPIYYQQAITSALNATQGHKLCYQHFIGYLQALYDLYLKQGMISIYLK